MPTNYENGRNVLSVGWSSFIYCSVERFASALNLGPSDLACSNLNGYCEGEDILDLCKCDAIPTRSESFKINPLQTLRGKVRPTRMIKW